MNEDATLREVDGDRSNGVASQALDDLVWAAVRLLGCSAAEAYLHDDAAAAYLPAAGSAPDAVPPGALLSADELSGYLPPGQRMLVVPDARALEGSLAAAARRMSAGSLLILRLDAGRKPLGVFLCAHRLVRAFTDADERAAEAFGRIAARTVEMALQAKNASEHAQRLAAVADSASIFAGQLDYDALLKALHEQARRHLNASGFYVAVEEDPGGPLCTEYAATIGEGFASGVLPPEHHAAYEVYRSGRSLALESGLGCGAAPSDAAFPGGTLRQSALIVPLRLRDRVVGVMAVQSERGVVYGPADLELLMEFARSAAAPILSAAALRAERRGAADVRVLYRLASLTNAEARFDRVAHAIVVEAAGAFAADAASVAVEDEHGDFRLAAAVGLSETYRERRVVGGAGLRTIYGDPPRACFLGPDALDRLGQPELMAAESLSSLYLAPMLLQGKLVGSLALYGRNRLINLSPNRGRLLQLFADQAAVALNRARSSHEIAEGRAELERYAEGLERRRRELELVGAVSAAAIATLDVDRMLTDAAELVAKGLAADRCAVAVIDDAGDEIEIVADVRSDGHQSNRGVRLPVEQHFALGYVVRERGPLVSEDLLADARFRDYRRHFAAWHLRGAAVVPMQAEGQIVGLLTVNSSAGPRLFKADEIAVLSTVANELALGIRNARLFERARERANRDSLTGLVNHRHLHELLEYELARARRAGQPLAIAMFDLNNFKMLNDQFGHQIGDDVLRLVAAALQSRLRGTDIAGRYGGDEFLVILPQSDEPGARLLMQRVSARLREEGVAGLSGTGVQISFGVAVYPRDGTTKSELIAAADHAMYEEKRRRVFSPA